jgi:hypothetical protein
MSETAIINSNGLPAEQRGTGAVVILCVIIVVSVLLYGAVDTGTLALLALLSFALVGYWTWVSMSTRALPISLSVVQLPIIALGIIGLIQILPFSGSSVPAGVLGIPAAASISLDPYATRFFLMRLFLFVVFFAAALTFINSISRLRIVGYPDHIWRAARILQHPTAGRGPWFHIRPATAGAGNSVRHIYQSTSLCCTHGDDIRFVAWCGFCRRCQT